MQAISIETRLTGGDWAGTVTAITSSGVVLTLDDTGKRLPIHRAGLEAAIADQQRQAKPNRRVTR